MVFLQYCNVYVLKNSLVLLKNKELGKIMNGFACSEKKNLLGRKILSSTVHDSSFVSSKENEPYTFEE